MYYSAGRNARCFPVKQRIEQGVDALVIACILLAGMDARVMARLMLTQSEIIIEYALNVNKQINN